MGLNNSLKLTISYITFFSSPTPMEQEVPRVSVSPAQTDACSLPQDFSFPEETLGCSGCSQRLPQSSFSSSQRRKADSQRRCKTCVACVDVNTAGLSGTSEARGPRGAAATKGVSETALISRADFDRTIKAAGDQLVVVNLGASWCGVCNKFAPFVAQLTSQFSSASPARVLFCKVDVDQSDELVNFLKPSALPCFIFFVRGKKVDTLVGAQQTALRKKVLKHSPS